MMGKICSTLVATTALWLHYIAFSGCKLFPICQFVVLNFLKLHKAVILFGLAQAQAEGQGPGLGQSRTPTTNTNF